MNTLITYSVSVLLIAAGIGTSSASVPTSQDNTWVSWDSPSKEGLRDWCCYDFNSKSPTRNACDLEQGGFSVFPESPGMGGHIRIFAKLQNGQPTKIRALSPSCPVSTPDVVHLGQSQPDVSVGWLKDHGLGTPNLAERTITAIAAHPSNIAVPALTRLIEPEQPLKTRENAVFWMMQNHAEDSADAVRTLMFEDEDYRFRKHAVFSIAQARLSSSHSDLVHVGTTDTNPEVRSDAWFWLANTGSSRAEVAILNAIHKEPSQKVQENAVFALSQLPGSRATDALIEVVETKMYGKNVRKQAMFWLAQSEDDRAFHYLETILSQASTH